MTFSDAFFLGALRVNTLLVSSVKICASNLDPDPFPGNVIPGLDQNCLAL